MKLAHIGLTVQSLDNAVQWYCTVFGFEEVRRFEKKDFEMKAAVISNGDMTLELIEPYKLNPIPKTGKSLAEVLRDQGLNHFAINVDDVQVTFENINNHNGDMVTPIIDGKFFFCRDPDGTLMEIRQG